MEPVIAIVGMVVMVGGVAAWMIYESKRRAAALAGVRATLEAQGWSLTYRDDRVYAPYTGEPFLAGRARRGEDIVRSPGGELEAFTYRWTTGSGKHVKHHTRRITTIAAGPVFPRLEVEPDTIVAKVRTAVAGGDHDVELADFNKAWSVRATDERVGHAILHPRMIERFMKPDLYGRAVFFEAGRIGIVDWVVQVEDIAVHAFETQPVLEELRNLLPDHLVREFS